MANEESELYLDMDAMDPALQPGTLVSKDRDAYSSRSYQRLIEGRTRTSAQMPYDMVLSADFDDRRRDAVDEAMMLGAWEYNSPGMNRMGRMEELDDESEVVEKHIDQSRADEIDRQALADARLPGAECPDMEVREEAYYKLRREAYRLKLEIARDRESGLAIRDYTLVKARIAAGAALSEVIDDLPVYWKKVLVMGNVSMARKGLMNQHVERLVANVAETGGGSVSGGGFMGRGRRGRRARNQGGDEDSW